MGTIVNLPAGARYDNAGYVSVPVETLPPGCRGAACPAFALCQGRCESKASAALARMVQSHGRQVAAGLGNR